MQCLAQRNQTRCTNPAQLTVLRVTTQDIELLIPLHVCEACGALLARTVYPAPEVQDRTS